MLSDITQFNFVWLIGEIPVVEEELLSLIIAHLPHTNDPLLLQLLLDGSIAL